MTEAKFNEWLETQPIEDKLVYLKYKYSHEEEWTFSNEILEVEMSVGGCYVWLNDWDEGQEDVEILGCISVSDIDVPSFNNKDEPQTDIEIARAIVHKMIDDAVIAEDAYPGLRQKMHDAVDNYEPQTETSTNEGKVQLTDCAWGRGEE